MMTQKDLQLIDELLEKRLKPIRKDVRKIKSDLSATIGFFDREVLGLGKRVDKIESHIGLTPGRG